METFRKTLSFLFWIAASIGLMFNNKYPELSTVILYCGIAAVYFKQDI